MNERRATRLRLLYFFEQNVLSIESLVSVIQKFISGYESISVDYMAGLVV